MFKINFDKVNTIKTQTINVVKTVKDTVVAHPKEAAIVAAVVAVVVVAAAVVTHVIKRKKEERAETKSFYKSILGYFTSSKKTTVTFETKEEVGQ